MTRILQGVTADISFVFCRGFAAELKAHGFETVFVSSPGEFGKQFCEDEGAEFVPVPMQRELSPKADFFSLLKMIAALRRVRPTLTNFGTPKAGLLGNIAATVLRVPCRVYMLRGLRLETAKGWKRSLLTATERIACKCAHRVICVSPSLRQRAIDLGLVDANKAVVLASGSSHGIEVEHFAPTPENLARAEEIRRELAVPDDVPVIGFVGRFTRDKGIPELIEAFDALKRDFPNLRLLLVGDFENGDPVPQKIREKIENDPQIVRPGFVSDTSPYYHFMDLLVLPTYREGFPGVPIEAQAAAKPVVTTNATGAIDSVQHGKTGFIVPVADANSLSDAIKRLLNDKPLRESMGKQGNIWVTKEFSGDRVRAALVDEYKSLLRETLGTKQRGYKLLIKRAFDATFAAFGLAITAPVLATVALLIRLTMSSPVLFRQTRPGKFGRPFKVLKFRTMNNARDSSGQLLPDSERLTRLGRFLRATSLDELPQLWNVFRGDMSLVGPRPLLMEYLDRYTPEQARRHDVIPGITGLAQVNGRNAISWEEKFTYDTTYVDNWSLTLDLRILISTALIVLKRDGISNSTHATMPEFQGSNLPN